MYSRWIEMELYRLQCVSSWPDSPFQRSTLAAIEHSLKRMGFKGDLVLKSATVVKVRKFENAWGSWNGLAA